MNCASAAMLLLLPAAASYYAPPAAVVRRAGAPPPPLQRRAPLVTMAAKTPAVSIEYCTRCNWMLRSAWMSQELLTTFNGTLSQVTLIPNHEGNGIFEVRCLASSSMREKVVWSRKQRERFPESKELKQLVRDLIEPGRNLGHSDSPAIVDAPPPEGFTWGDAGDDAPEEPEPEPEPAPPKGASKASWAVWRLLRGLRPERITDEARAEARKLGLENDDDE